MRKFTVIMLIAALAASGIYTGLWYLSAYRLKQEISEFFATDHPAFFLKHEGIKSKGFPFKIEATIKNPLFGTRTSTSVSNKVSTEGNWTLGATILRTKGWMEIVGKTQIGLLDSHACALNGTLCIEVPQVNTCLETSKQLKTVFPDKWSKLMWEIFLRNASLYAKKLSLSCGADDQPLLEVDNLRFNWEEIPGSASYSWARLMKLDMQGYEVHQKELARLLYSYSEDLKQMNLWTEDVKEYGKSNLNMQARILYSTLEGKKISPFCIEVEKMTYSSDRGDSGAIQGKFKIEAPQADAFSGLFSMNALHKGSSQSHDFAVSQYRSMAKKFQKLGYFAQYPKWENLIMNHWDQVAALIPDYSSLGSIETQIDLGFHVRREGAQDEDWSLDLKKCAIKTPAYEIAVKCCKGFRDSNEAAFFEVQIPHYQEFIQALAGYYNRWQAVLTSTQTLSEVEMPYVNEKVLHRMSEFCAALSQPGSSNDLHLVIRRKGSNDIAVGPFNAESFLSEFQKLIVDVTTEMYRNRSHQSF